MGHLNFLSCLIFSFLLKNGRHAPASSRVSLKVSHFLLCSNIRSRSLNSILERSFHSRYNSSCCSPAAAIPGANSNYVLQITQSNKSPATLLQSEQSENFITLRDLRHPLGCPSLTKVRFKCFQTQSRNLLYQLYY